MKIFLPWESKLQKVKARALRSGVKYHVMEMPSRDVHSWNV